MIIEIPVSFQYEGMQYNGVLTSVGGAGFEAGKRFHLNIDGYYRGQFFLAEYSDTPLLPWNVG